MGPRRLCIALLVLLSVYVRSAGAGTVLIIVDFEGISDLTPFINQQAEATFLNATVLSTSLNDAEFPPHSGIAVAFDDGGPMSITFSQPAVSVSGYLTYTHPLTIQGLDATDTLVASSSSLFANNLALSGDPGSSPNELFLLTYAGGISKVILTGDPGGSSFVVDDLTFDQPSASDVPEPGEMIPLCALGLVALARGRRRVSRGNLSI